LITDIILKLLEFITVIILKPTISWTPCTNKSMYWNMTSVTEMNEEETEDLLHNTLKKHECVCSKLSCDDVILIQALWVLLHMAIHCSCTEVNKFCVAQHTTVCSLLVIDTIRRVEELKAASCISENHCKRNIYHSCGKISIFSYADGTG
jgi:hypothetical protein